MVKYNPGFAEQLRSTSDTIQIDDRRYCLMASVNLDQSLIFDKKDKNGLLSASVLTEVDSLPIPVYFQMTRKWVINGNEIWESRFEELRSYEPFQWIGISRGGPKWYSNIEVDVVCKFKNVKTKKTYKIIVRKQPVSSLS